MNSLLIALLLLLLSVPAAAACGYLLLLTLLSRRPTPPPAPASARHRFAVVVPAHNEAANIASTLENIAALDYPRDSFEVFVVADNCADDTAEIARASGATVLVRKDERLRGKGYALLFAFDRVAPSFDAAVVIDADTYVSPNLLRAFSARLSLGAQAVQADYAVRNPHAAWRTRLMAIAFGSFHIVRSRGRERLGLSAGLRGNGMCFSSRILQEVRHEAFSIVEDVEYGIRLAEAGHRVYYADEAHVYGEMVSSAAPAGSQRRRWEQGRSALARTFGARLLREGWARRSKILFDLGLDLLVPPLSTLSIWVGLGWTLSAAAAWPARGSVVPFAVFSACLLALIAYVIRGWMVSGTGLRGLVDLALAPIYVVWKIVLRLRRPPPGPAQWVRTTREADRGSAATGQVHPP